MCERDSNLAGLTDLCRKLLILFLSVCGFISLALVSFSAVCSRVVHKKCHLSVLTDCVAKKPENLEDVSREEGGREERKGGREGAWV